MKIIDIIAILGALAWLPQIFAWIYHWLQKPKIQIFNEEEAEVGFIKFGNAFNIRISFLARKKHALIDNIELELEDKDGAKHNLTYIIHSGFISGYQNRYGDNLKPPTNVYHRMTA